MRKKGNGHIWEEAGGGGGEYRTTLYATSRKGEKVNRINTKGYDEKIYGTLGRSDGGGLILPTTQHPGNGITSFHILSRTADPPRLRIIAGRLAVQAERKKTLEADTAHRQFRRRKVKDVQSLSSWTRDPISQKKRTEKRLCASPPNPKQKTKHTQNPPKPHPPKTNTPTGGLKNHGFDQEKHGENRPAPPIPAHLDEGTAMPKSHRNLGVANSPKSQGEKKAIRGTEQLVACSRTPILTSPRPSCKNPERSGTPSPSVRRKAP